MGIIKESVLVLAISIFLISFYYFIINEFKNIENLSEIDNFLIKTSYAYDDLVT